MKKLNVILYTSKNIQSRIGTLSHTAHKIYFEYSAQFLENPLWLSPFKLPPEQKFHEHKDLSFGPVFGLFDDSLPDGWGLLLMDRYLRKMSIDPKKISVLDRLAFLGQSTMGALTYEPAMDFEPVDTQIFDIHELAKHSRKILQGKTTIIIPQLMKAGGSPGGARPKILAGIKGNTIISGEHDLPEGFEHWIIKFTSKNDFLDAGLIEYAYSLMAKAAGIEMTATKVFETDKNDHFFGIKRFDRLNNRRFHIHTFGNLIHSNFRIPSCDYALFLKTTRSLTQNHQDVIKGFKQMIFNILANNRDDHVKNFSFMLDKHDEWHLTPAYDLTFSHGPGGQHSMTMLGEAQNPGKKEIANLGRQSGLSNSEINNCLEQIVEAVKQWPEFARQSNVTQKSMEKIRNRMGENIKLL